MMSLTDTVTGRYVTCKQTFMNQYNILYLSFSLFLQTTETRLTSDSGEPIELHAGREVQERLRHFRQGRSDL